MEMYQVCFVKYKALKMTHGFDHLIFFFKSFALSKLDFTSTHKYLYKFHNAWR